MPSLSYDPENLFNLVAQYTEAFFTSGNIAKAIDALNKAGSKRDPGKRFWLLWDDAEGLVLYQERKDTFPLVLNHLSNVTWLVTGEDMVCTKHRWALDSGMITLSCGNMAKLHLSELKGEHGGTILLTQ
jgi:hypothetical protein